MYGNTIKYEIPLLTPSAIETSPFSTTALHIAHCEKEVLETKTNNKNKTTTFLCNIIWRNH